MTDYIDGCRCPGCTEQRAASDTRPPNPVNAQALIDIIPVLRELDDQGRFDMGMWAEGVVNPNADSYTECGTQFCLAGAKAAVDGWRPQYRLERRWDHLTDTDVLTGKAIATGKFVRPENRHITDEDSPLAQSARDIAMKAFGLDDDQAMFLFHGTHISRVTDLVRRIQWLIDGERPDTYPQALIELERRHGAEDEGKREEAKRRALQPVAAQ